MSGVVLCRHENECPKPIVPHVVTPAEQDMLKASVYHVATEMNKNEHVWNPILLLIFGANSAINGIEL